MEYCYITLCPVSQKICTIVQPWDKFDYQKSPMRLCNSPDIFQEKVNRLFNCLEYARACEDDL